MRMGGGRRAAGRNGGAQRDNARDDRDRDCRVAAGGGRRAGPAEHNATMRVTIVTGIVAWRRAAQERVVAQLLGVGSVGRFAQEPPHDIVAQGGEESASDDLVDDDEEEVAGLVVDLDRPDPEVVDEFPVEDCRKGGRVRVR